MGFLQWLFRLRKKEVKIKMGLALGSGGAKGFAELGALKAFEENGVEFDVIAGASIGSIVGAFYADGYTSTDILELLKTINVSDIKSTFMINMDTSGLANVISKAIGDKNIEELKKPFRVIATDLESGEEKVFDSGSVAQALCASSSYPPFFKPVIIDGKRYIDGAFTNSVPADVVKGLGADFVVGIDLSTHESKGGLLSRIFPTYESKVKEPWAKGYENSNVMLHPDLSSYKAISFNDGEKMYEIGYHTAINQMDEIKSMIDEFKTQTKKAKKKKNKDKNKK